MQKRIKNLLSFPHPVNEVAARLVAGMVVCFSLTIIITDAYWLITLLAYGFLARVLTGPKLTPFGLIATKVVLPLVGNPTKLVAGPPKRFAQTVGLVFALGALVSQYWIGSSMATEVVLGILIIFALLESLVGFCTGCYVFAYLMKWGFIPEETCRKCADINLERG
jgi:hypothetical protein